MKITIEVNVPYGVDLEHAQQSISDATYFAGNVTQLEHNLVCSILSRLQVEQDRVVEVSRRETNHTYNTTSVSQIATQIKNMVEKIQHVITTGKKSVLLDWDSNVITFDSGYLVPRASPKVETSTYKFMLDHWEELSEPIKQLYWKASSLDYVLVRFSEGELLIELCSNIEDKDLAKKVAHGNYQEIIYDCNKNKEIHL